MPPVSQKASSPDYFQTFETHYIAQRMWRLKEDHPDYTRCKYYKNEPNFGLVNANRNMKLPDKQMFKKGWLHPETVPIVTAIYLASKSELQNSFRGQRFDRWR